MVVRNVEARAAFRTTAPSVIVRRGTKERVPAFETSPQRHNLSTQPPCPRQLPDQVSEEDQRKPHRGPAEQEVDVKVHDNNGCPHDNRRPFSECQSWLKEPPRHFRKKRIKISLVAVAVTVLVRLKWRISRTARLHVAAHVIILRFGACAQWRTLRRGYIEASAASRRVPPRG